MIAGDVHLPTPGCVTRNENISGSYFMHVMPNISVRLQEALWIPTMKSRGSSVIVVTRSRGG